MDNPFKPLADQFDSMLTAVIADKTKAFDLDETLPMLPIPSSVKPCLELATTQNF